MPETPLFSIVVPSYQQGAFLEQALLSVLGQEGASVELIVMDGGSTDGSRSILERYGPRLAYWQCRPDGGQAAALRAGFERSRGQILGWLNSDDVYLPGALAAVAEAFAAHPRAVALSGGAYFVDEQGRFTRFGRVGYTRGVAASFDRLRYYDSDGVFQPATFYRREAYFRAGEVDPSFHFSMDRDLLTRVAKLGPLIRLPRFLAAARVHAATKTMTLKALCLHENARIQAGQGGMDGPAWIRRARWWRHHLPNLGRKAALAAAERVGLQRFERAHWEAGGA